MTAAHWSGSLRARLAAACALIQLLVSLALWWGGSAILKQTLSRQATYQTRQVSALLNESLATALAQRDYATLQQTVERVVSDEGIHYLVLSDHRGRVVASAGWNRALPLPPRDGGEVDLQRADATLHLASAIALSGQGLGQASFGLSTQDLRSARATFLRQSFAIAAMALLLSTALVTALAVALTRRLVQLEQSSRRIAQGHFDVSVPAGGNDEISRLGASFNTMAQALRERVAALYASEVLQGKHLHRARTGQAQLAALLDAVPAGILFVDETGCIAHVNDAFAKLWRIEGNLLGSAVAELVLRLRLLTSANDQHLLDSLSHAPDAGDTVSDAELTTQDRRLVAQRVRPVLQGGTTIGYLCFHEDITSERQMQRRAAQAMYDPLTGLLNRRGLFEALASAMQNAVGQGSALALMFVDLDDFKRANDVGGHRTGDDILIAVGAALTAEMRPDAVVARIGGDEFALVCPDLAQPEGGQVAARLVAAVSRLRFTTEHEVLTVGCSIGIACFPDDGMTPNELVAAADSAMYRAKQQGKNGWRTCRDILSDRDGAT